MPNRAHTTTFHLLVGSLLLALLATTLLARLERQPVGQPALVTIQHQASTKPSPGFASAFGQGAALRNLIF